MGNPLRFFILLILFSFLKLSYGQTLVADTTVIEEGATAEQFLNYAMELCNQNNFDGCIRACEKVLVVEPGYSKALSIIAHAYAKQKIWDTCLLYGQRALTLNPVISPELYRDLNDAYNGNNDWHSAISWSENFLKTEPDNQEVKNNISYDLERIKDDFTSGIIVDVFFLIMVIILLVYYLPESRNTNGRSGLLELLLSS